jgi:hypothetical protein
MISHYHYLGVTGETLRYVGRVITAIATLLLRHKGLKLLGL